MTTENGLKIHQGKKDCLKKQSKGPHIDHYFLRSRANQLNEAQWQDNHHSPQGIRTQDDAQLSATHPMDGIPKPTQPQAAVEKKMDG